MNKTTANYLFYIMDLWIYFLNFNIAMRVNERLRELKKIWQVYANKNKGAVLNWSISLPFKAINGRKNA